MAEAQEAKLRHAGSLKTCPCFMATNIPLAKASHVTMPNIKGVSPTLGACPAYLHGKGRGCIIL